MLSSDSVKEIANIFCGDIGDFYTYKQGYKLVKRILVLKMCINRDFPQDGRMFMTKLLF